MKNVSTQPALLTGILVLAFAMTPCTEQVSAQSPLKKIKLPFQKKVATDPNGNYELQETNGPWMIMAASFEGEGGDLQARQLVQEIRQEFNLPAYIYKERFDFSKEVAGRDWQLDPNDPERIVRKKMVHAQNKTIDETAVLVGDFATLDDPKAQKVLQQLKMARPKALPFGDGVKTFQRMGELRAAVGGETAGGKGPMRSAFMCPNPALPENYFERQGPDEFILKLNKKVKYSLLDCPGGYTVRVATFRGDTSFDSKEVEEKEKAFNLKKLLGKQVESKLAMAADKANKLTVALRKRKIEAYEFHDRCESYVCVGSFNSIGTPRPDGRLELDPRVHKVIEMYRGEVDGLPGIAGVAKPKTLPELPRISFDLQPLPVEVPRQSVLDRTARRGQSPR